MLMATIVTIDFSIWLEATWPFHIDNPQGIHTRGLGAVSTKLWSFNQMYFFPLLQNKITKKRKNKTMWLSVYHYNAWQTTLLPPT